MRYLGSLFGLLIGFAPTNAISDEIVLDIEGSTDTRTRPITLAGPWELGWEVQCNEGKTCFVDLEVQDLAGNVLKRIGAEGPGEPGTYFFPDGGTFLVEVDVWFGAHWRVTVIAL